MKIFLHLLTLLLPFFVDAQDTSLAKKYDEKVVFLYGNNYMLDGQKLPKSSLSILLNKFPDTRIEYRTSKKFTTIGNVLNLTAFVIPFYGIQQYRNNNKDLLPYLVGSVVVNYIAVPFIKKGKKHLHKSIWLYNKNALVN